MLQSQLNFIYTASVRVKVLYRNPEPDAQTSSTSTEKSLLPGRDQGHLEGPNAAVMLALI